MRLDVAFGGRWTVRTESGTGYLFDLDAMTVRRDSGTGALRRDDEDLVLWMLGICQVGRPAVLVLQVRTDGMQTIRTTSPVVSIVRVGRDNSAPPV